MSNLIEDVRDKNGAKEKNKERINKRRRMTCEEREKLDKGYSVWIRNPAKRTACVRSNSVQK